ncbi:MAG: acetate--CoA ligase family protein [Pseudomonadota bacterium]
MSSWTQAQMASIHKMLNPRSVAVVGATPRMQYGGKFLKRVLNYKDRLNVYPVNPKYDEILGEKSYPSIADLPEAVDVATIIVPYHAVLETLKECKAKGVGSAIVISAGFSERGEDDRRELQERVGAYARESGVRISGPNCLGLANVRDNVWLTSSSRVDGGTPGPVGLVCQSGASLFGPFLARALDMGLGMSYVVSTGNEADLEFADFARYLLDDEGTKVIAGFIEGFKNAEKFIEVAQLAQERGKPIVLIKIGRSDLGSRAASSHTAALTGSDKLYDAVCRQYGVIRVQNYDELLETAQLLARAKPTIARGVAVVSHSGGVSSLTADMIGQAGLQLPELTDRAKDGINAILKGFGWASNPADVTGKANSDDFPAIIRHLIDEPEVGTLVVASAGGDPHADQLLELRDHTEKNVVYLWTGSRNQTTGLPKLKAAGLPVFYNPDSLAKGLRHLLDYHDFRRKRAAHPAQPDTPATAAQLKLVDELQARGRITLSETDSKSLIAAWGVAVSRDERASSAQEAAQAAARTGFPVVMKIDSADIPHKTEAGGVRLGLRDATEVAAAFDEIMANARAYSPQARLDGVMVQEMVQGGVETIVGVTYDAQLGPTIMFGSGGVMVEVYQDVTLRRCPINLAEAHEMIAEVKGSKRLTGFRGSAPADIDALAQTLVDVSRMAVQLKGRLAELDINPLLVLPKGRGVKAVDALATFSQEEGAS